MHRMVWFTVPGRTNELFLPLSIYLPARRLLAEKYGLPFQATPEEMAKKKAGEQPKSLLAYNSPKYAAHTFRGANPVPTEWIKDEVWTLYDPDAAHVGNIDPETGLLRLMKPLGDITHVYTPLMRPELMDENFVYTGTDMMLYNHYVNVIPDESLLEESLLEKSLLLELGPDELDELSLLSSSLELDDPEPDELSLLSLLSVLLLLFSLPPPPLPLLSSFSLSSFS